MTYTRCECDSNTDYTEICNATCQTTTQPTITLELTSDGTISIVITDPSGTSSTITKTGVIGPDETTTGANNVFVINFFDFGVAGSVYADATSAQDIQQDLPTLAAGAVFGRRRLLATTLPANQIVNPAMCLEIGEIVLFNVWIDSTKRSLSHYPVYVKNHLYNTNPNFDYGAFTQLQNLIDNTNATITSFAHAFVVAGTYVFADAQEPNWEMVVEVVASTSSCSSGSARMMPATTSNLIGLGVNKQSVANEEPDWGIIIGLIAFFAALVVLLVVAVIVWKPHDSVIFPVKHWKPKYRKLGLPPPVPSYLRYDPDNWPERQVVTSDLLGPRPGAEGAEAEPSWLDKGSKSIEDLEDFNARVLYDKLEDQNLHLASQLARQQEDLEGFYNKISQQNEDLKRLLNDLDPEKLASLEARQAALDRDRLQTSASGGPTIVGANVVMGAGVKGKLHGTASNRESDLMQALQLLLDKLNSGNIPLSQEMWDKMQGGGAAGVGTVTNINISGSGTHTQVSGSQGELLRHQNNERIQLERELASDEREALNNLLQQQDDKQKKLTKDMADALSLKLQGDLSEAEIQSILDNHEKDLQLALDKHNKNKDKQLEDLRHKLAERRRNREAQLREKQQLESEAAGLPAPVPTIDDTETKLQTEENLLSTLHSQEIAGLAKAEMDTDHSLAQEHRRRLNSSMIDQTEALESQNFISEDQAKAIMDQQKALESQLHDKFEKQRQNQLNKLHMNMEKCRQQRLRALQQQQENERGRVSSQLTQEDRHEDKERILKALDLQHQQEREAMEAQLLAEENEQGKQLSKALDDDHTALLKDGHRKMTEQLLASTAEGDRLAAQRILDQHRRDLDSLDKDLESEKTRQLADVQAKLASRREMKLKEGIRQQEMLAAQKFISEQSEQMKTKGREEGASLSTDLHHMPTLVYAQTSEEQALKRDQERTQEEMKKRHQKERDQMAIKLDSEHQKKEQDQAHQLDGQMEQVIREKKNKQAAEEAARTDLSQEELAALMARHAQEVDDLMERLDSEKTRQQLALRDKLAEQRRRRMEELRRQQDAELMSEMLEQKGELGNIRLSKAKQVEQKAIEEGIKQNGQEEGDKVVQAVLAQRHAQELKELEDEFMTRKKIIVDDKLGNLGQKYDKMREDMAKRQEKELADLEKLPLPPEEKQEHRTALLNQHHMEMSKLEHQLDDERSIIEKGALKDWEVEFARTKLALKERHYKEFAEALREFTNDQEKADAAEQAAGELAKVRAELDQRRKHKEEEIKREKDAFEKSENKRLNAEISAFAKDLEQETVKEKEKQERNIEALNKRKDELVKEKKAKMKEDLEKLKSEGASKDEQSRLIKEYEESTAVLVNKMEADRLRMQSNLQEKLKRRKDEKLKNKEMDAKENIQEQKLALESQLRSEEDRLKTDEVLTINEALNVSGPAGGQRLEHVPLVAAAPTAASVAPTEDQEPMPLSYTMAAPLNEAELMALLMASPLYKKLEGLKNAVANGNLKTTPSVAPGEGYMDDREKSWPNDKDLKPMDLNKLNAKSFIIYKFGCHVANMIARRCQHSPVNILLAETIPANEQLARNMYKNSFTYDANNRLLYVRAARLETVGEYLMVLAHCLAHIKSGDLRDDTNPEFMREYQKALTVICDELFLTQTKRPGETTLGAKTAQQNLQAMFDSGPSEDTKTRMMEDLLDIKLMPDTCRDGAKLTKERMAQRISKYSDFSSLNCLQSALGEMEDKVHQARGQGSKDNVWEQLANLSSKFLSQGSTVLSRPLDPPSFVMANMSGTALYQTFENSTDKEYTMPTNMDPQDSTEDQLDKLSADFSRTNQRLVEEQDRVQALEDEITSEMSLVDSTKGSDQTKHSDLLKTAQENLISAKSEFARLQIEKSRLLEALQTLQGRPAKVHFEDGDGKAGQSKNKKSSGKR